MPNLLLVGDTNNGKTMIVNRFQHQHSATDNPGGEHVIVPVLLVQAPPVPDEGRFYANILEALAAPYRARGPAGERQMQVIHLLRTIGVQLLIIDEIHHILSGPINRQRQFLNVLKYLGNELKIPLVGVGTIDAVRAIQTDPQLANRFEPVALRRWQMNRDWQMLLASFERILPLRKPSQLAELSTATALLAWSEGTIGELASLLRTAAIAAIEAGEECISERLLKRIDWTPPSSRRTTIEAIL
jgi:ATP-dependent Clp protease ATP-binding subunit ClpA